MRNMAYIGNISKNIGLQDKVATLQAATGNGKVDN